MPQEVPLQRLDNHLRLYEKDFRCEGCGKEYHGTRESMNHKRFKKPSEDFDLILCQKAFSSCSNFYQHPLGSGDVCEEDFIQPFETQKTSS